MRNNLEIVARPAGVYVPNRSRNLVWRTGFYRPAHFQASCGSLANQNGPKQRANATPALIINAIGARND